MKIAFMTSGTVNSSISYRALSFAKELVKKEHEVYVFSPRFDKYSKFKDEKITLLDGVHVVRPLQIKGVPFELGLIAYILSSIFLLLRIHPDVVHIYKTNPITICGLVVKVFKKKIVADFDDLDVEVMKIEGHSMFLTILVHISTKLALRYSDAITVASTYLKKVYTEKQRKIVVVSNGAEFDKKVYFKPNNKPDLVFVGNINRKNILEPLFFALENLLKKKVEIHAEIIGDGEYSNYFKSLARKLKISQAVKFLGYVKQTNLQNHLQPGNLGYCVMPDEPTTQACSSMKVFQYMQNGVVPLVSTVGDLPAYTFHGRAGYITKTNNTEELAKTVEKALKEKNERYKKLQFCTTYASKKYSWNALSNKIDLLYRNII